MASFAVVGGGDDDDDDNNNDGDDDDDGMERYCRMVCRSTDRK